MPIIIIDRKHKKRNFDTDWTDPFGIEEVKKSHANEIVVPKDSDNPIHKFLKDNPIKSLIGKKAYSLNDRKEMITGYIVDVIPPDLLHIKGKGVFTFKDIVTLED